LYFQDVKIYLYLFLFFAVFFDITEPPGTAHNLPAGPIDQTLQPVAAQRLETWQRVE
jgi:hypothetical protein